MMYGNLKHCPFCGGPPEIVDGEPYSFFPDVPTKRLRCRDPYGCPGHDVNIRFFENDEQSRLFAYRRWNTRRRKNKGYFYEGMEEVKKDD